MDLASLLPLLQNFQTFFLKFLDSSLQSSSHLIDLKVELDLITLMVAIGNLNHLPLH